MPVSVGTRVEYQKNQFTEFGFVFGVQPSLDVDKSVSATAEKRLKFSVRWDFYKTTPPNP